MDINYQYLIILAVLIFIVIIVLKANKGRKQIVTKVGVLENVYPSVFVVKLDGTSDGNQRVSYSYSDLLTANVKLQICKNKENKLSAS